MHQVQDFLQTHDTITNTLACIVRAFEDVEFISVFLVVSAIIGVHLVEPFLALTMYKNEVTYEDLIPMSKELYEDLQTTDPEKLLCFNSFAFSFAEKRLDLDDVIDWEDPIMESLKEAAFEYKEKVLVCLRVLLPELAKAWFTQRANVLGFGDFDENSPRLVTKIDPEKLKEAPINNIASEQAVGSINHELGIRGRKELDAASSCFLKGKSFDLIELKPVDEFIKYRKLIGTINQLIADWKKMQDELKAKGLDQKQQASLATKKRKMNDLQKLKSYGGPFTTAEEVDQMLENTELSDAQKASRLYTEVRYARDTTLSLPQKSPIFRLKDSRCRNLPMEHYIKNIKVYLSKISSSSAAT